MSWNVEYKAGPNYSAETMKDIFEDKIVFKTFKPYVVSSILTLRNKFCS